jgi:hypothetical protein
MSNDIQPLYTVIEQPYLRRFIELPRFIVTERNNSAQSIKGLSVAL